MKNYLVLFLVGFVDGLVALACLSYAYYNLSAGWAFFLGVVYAQTVPHLTKRAADWLTGSAKSKGSAQSANR